MQIIKQGFGYAEPINVNVNYWYDWSRATYATWIFNAVEVLASDVSTPIPIPMLGWFFCNFVNDWYDYWSRATYATWIFNAVEVLASDVSINTHTNTNACMILL